MLLKRTCDIIGVLLALIVFAIPMAIVALAVRATSPGPALYWSQRVGRDNRLFSMPKFRTMRTDTPVVVKHLLGTVARYLTPSGSVLVVETAILNAEYFKRRSFLFDLRILSLTAIRVVGAASVKNQ